MQFIAAALLMIAFGYSQIAFKDFWWWDSQLLFVYFGINVERTAAWDRRQDLWGRMWIVAGLTLLACGLATLLV